MPRRTAKPAVEEEIEDLEVDDLEVEDEEPEDLEVDETEEGDEADDEEEGDEVEEFDELEVEEEDEEEEEPPAKSRRTSKKPAAKKPAAKKAAAEPTFGTKQLVDHVNKATNKNMDGRAVRIVLRRLANEGVIKRSVGDDRGRYSFTGPNDPQVKAVVAAIKAGAGEKKPATTKKPAAKKPAARKPAAKKPATTTRRRKPAAK